LNEGQVTLYFLRDHLRLRVDYFQVASESARFVFDKPSEAFFDAICSRLESDLNTRRERGIPVDRLIKRVEQPQSQRKR
jgi:hypothetical protein